MLIIVTLAAASCKTAPEGEQAKASTVMKLTGAARRSLDGKTWNAISVGDWIPSGSIVHTASGFDYLDISLGEETIHPGLYDSALHRANLLRLYDDSVVKLKKITSERLPNSKDRKDAVEVVLLRGTILGIVKSQNQNSGYKVGFKGGVLVMQQGRYKIDSLGNVDVLDGQGEIRMPARNLTNRLSDFKHFDAKTITVTNFTPPPSNISE